jgi:hypothetical protein
MIKLGGEAPGNAAPAGMILVQNWFEEMKARLPAQ